MTSRPKPASQDWTHCGIAWIAAIVVWTCLPGVASSACPQDSEQHTIWVAVNYVAAADGAGRGDDDGIGGTGLSSDGDDDGIGGTGLFGTVTGFGSICLNGRRIQYTAEVPVSYGGEAATSNDLEIGQVVAVVAREEQALAIDIVFVVVGSVEKISAANFTVLGQVVEPAAGSIVDRDALVVGSRVAVSGLRRPDGTIVASRVDPASAALADSVADLGIDALFGAEVDQIDVEGYVFAAGADGLNLGYVQIDGAVLESDQSAELPAVGARVRVRAARGKSGGFKSIRVELVREVRLLRDFQRLDRERLHHQRRPDSPLGHGSMRPPRPDRLEKPNRPDNRHPNDRSRARGRGGR